MDSITLTRSPAKSSIVPKLSTLRRKGAEVFSSCAFSSNNPWDPNDSELEDQVLPSESTIGQDMDSDSPSPTGSPPAPQTTLTAGMSSLRDPRRRSAPSTHSSPIRTGDEKLDEEDKWVVVDSPAIRNNVWSPTPMPAHLIPARRPMTASPRLSTLRRKTDEVFGVSNSFDEDETEFGEPSSVFRPSTLRQKTEELFTDSTYSSNPFDLDDSEYDGPSPDHTVHNKPLPSLRILRIKRAEAAVSLVSVEASSEKIATKQHVAVGSLSKAHLKVLPNTPLVSPGLSTFKRESAKLLAESNIWEDHEESVAKLETMRLNPTQPVRGNLLKSMLASHSPSSLSLAVSDKENVSSYRSTRPSPLRSILDAPEATSATSKMVGLTAFKVEDNNGGPVKSIWVTDEDEFDRWPDKYDLAARVESFATHRGTYKGLKHHSASLEVKGEIGEDSAPIRGTNMTEQEHDDYMHELLDKNCGNPDGLDAHDEVMQQFYQRDVKLLPASNPAGYPHIIGVKAYMSDGDRNVHNARPRLADAVATVLYLTHPKCLADFLDPNVKLFEWCRSKDCVLIRRKGNKVIIGTYWNYDTCYVWTYFVRSRISETGAWKDVYAGASQIIMPVTAKGVEFEKGVAEPTRQGIDPTDEKYALYMGRMLGGLFLEKEIWGCPTSRITWEVDGKVTNAREYAYDTLRLAYEEEDDSVDVQAHISMHADEAR